DLALTQISTTIGGQSIKQRRQAYIDGNDVVLYTAPRALAHGKTYYVLVQSGAIRGPDGAFSIPDPNAWSFKTGATAPAIASPLRVALDGSGAFCSLQGALDAVPSGNGAALTIEIAKGSYRGVVYFAGKHNLTLHGADRAGVVLSGVNNNALNPST